MKRLVFFAAIALILALCAAQVQADRLIVIPTGSLVGSPGFKAEAAFRGGEGDSIFVPKDSDQINWVNLGLGRFEVEARRLVDAGGMDKITVGVEAGLLPETMITPAVGIGVRDLTNEVEPSYYAVVTKSISPLDAVPTPIHDIKVHGGFGINGELSGFFVGAQAGLPMGLTLQAEHDSEQFNAALGWSGIPKVNLKVYSLDSEIFYGASLNLSF